jgi:hypothetical protein
MSSPFKFLLLLGSSGTLMFLSPEKSVVATGFLKMEKMTKRFKKFD